MFNPIDIINIKSMPNKFAEMLNAKANIEVKAGAGASSVVTLADAPQTVIAVLAVTTATGAVATKFLLAPTTDYTVSGKELTCVTSQSANTLIIIYK